MNLNILTVPSLYVLVLLTHFVKSVHQYETEEGVLRESTRRKGDIKLLKAAIILLMKFK